MGNKNQPNGVMEIDLLQLFRALWRNALVIILVAILFGGIAFGGTYMFISPKYEASAMMYVNNSSVTLGNTSVSITSGELSAAQTLVNTYIVILKSRATLDEVIQEAGVPYSVEKLSNMVSASAVSGTGIFRIKVESSSPTEAYAIVPAHRSSPSYTKNTAIGVLAGVVLVAGIICLKEILTSGEDVIIHSTDDLKELFPEIPVLAVVPDMRITSKKGYYSAYSSYYGSDKKEAK